MSAPSRWGIISEKGYVEQEPSLDHLRDLWETEVNETHPSESNACFNAGIPIVVSLLIMLVKCRTRTAQEIIAIQFTKIHIGTVIQSFRSFAARLVWCSQREI